MTMTDTRGQELATQQPAALAIRRGQNFWDDKQRAALAVLGIKSASNGELAVFFHYCQRTGLDPFSRQIYMTPRREKQDGQWVEKQTIQVGIDGVRGARRPENRVTARSKLPQKKCTGLDLPMNRPRNSSKTESAETSARQKRFAYSGSYDACTRSSSKRIGLGISTGMGQIFTRMPRDASASMNSW